MGCSTWILRATRDRTSRIHANHSPLKALKALHLLRMSSAMSSAAPYRTRNLPSHTRIRLLCSAVVISQVSIRKRLAQINATTVHHIADLDSTRLLPRTIQTTTIAVVCDSRENQIAVGEDLQRFDVLQQRLFTIVFADDIIGVRG